jgi:hypothetical protein
VFWPGVEPATAGNGWESILDPNQWGVEALLFICSVPVVLSNRTLHLGQAVDVRGEDVTTAGRYTVIPMRRYVPQCSLLHRGSFSCVIEFPCSSVAGDGSNKAVPSAAWFFRFDKFQNLVLSPVTVNFKMTTNKNSLFSRAVPTRQGVAWFRSDSGNTAGLSLAIGLW